MAPGCMAHWLRAEALTSNPAGLTLFSTTPGPGTRRYRFPDYAFHCENTTDGGTRRSGFLMLNGH
ncbi:hypothetical protein [Mycobacterium simiae]|uniref:hypothetical protein n=1 Tax=Mycobacterium simiae TaxID=1784 RepID=UPI001E607C7F|nr:hypothetical protein [Mycobacterium simiae]